MVIRMDYDIKELKKELDGLYENLGEWDGIRIDARADGDWNLQSKARAMCERIENRINEIEDILARESITDWERQ